MTPHAGRVPALPVLSDSALPPLPRSSVPEWQTTVRCENKSVAAFEKHSKASAGKKSTYADDALGADKLDELVSDGAF